jgi:hydroxymethylpyrimidine pyrophosphatase-like HAD family hydrolase
MHFSIALGLAKLLHIKCMKLNAEQESLLERFFEKSSFSTKGAVITDLDGTAVHENNGRTVIHQSVELGLKQVHELGRPVIINTLRFPLSVIKTFAHDWFLLSNSPIPVILLNGSQLGYITHSENGFAFEQLVSFPLMPAEINDVIASIKRLTDARVDDFILFYYPENWKHGEIIWTPVPEKIPYLQEKYKSASSVISTDLNDLHRQLLSIPVCMIFLLIEIPQDQLMAYQHTRRSNFVTHRGVDKLFGAQQMASRLGVDLFYSIGAGDSEMDTFLNGIGLSVHISNPSLPFKGGIATLKLPGFFEFGDLLSRIAGKQYAE